MASTPGGGALTCVWVAPLGLMTDPSSEIYGLFVVKVRHHLLWRPNYTTFGKEINNLAEYLSLKSHFLFCSCCVSKLCLVFARFVMNLTPNDPTAGRVVVLEVGSGLERASLTLSCLAECSIMHSRSLKITHPERRAPQLCPVRSGSPRVEHSLI